MLSLADIIREEERTLIEDLKNSFNEKDLVATGRTRDSIEGVSEALRLKIIGNKSIGALQPPGRSPSKKNDGGLLLEAIKEWVKFRGIPDEAAYPITRKIHEQGINVPNQRNKGNVISDVINEARLQSIADKTGRNILDFFTSEYKKIILQR